MTKKMITVRVSEEVRNALNDKAIEKGVSLNTLCLDKLMELLAPPESRCGHDLPHSVCDGPTSSPEVNEHLNNPGGNPSWIPRP